MIFDKPMTEFSNIALCAPVYFVLIALFVFSLTLLFFKRDIGCEKLPPGPWKLPLIGNLHQLGSLPHRSLMQLSETYGDVMLLQLGRVPTVIISSANAARQVLKIHDLKCCTRPPMTSTGKLSYGFRDLAFAPHGDYWREIRKFCVLQLYSPKRVSSFQFIREQEVGTLVEKLSMREGRRVELCEMIFPCTASIVCRFAFGKSFKETGLDNGRFQELLHEAILMAGSFSAADLFPELGWIGDRFTGLRGRLERIFMQLDRFYQNVIDDQLHAGRTNQVHEHIVGLLLEIADKNQKDQISSIALTHQHIKAIMTNVFLGGVDSSSVTIIWAMTELIKNPRVMKKAQDEVRNYLGGQAKVSEADTDQLLYLKMVMKETLRLHPPAPFLIPRQAMSHFTVNGYTICPKTRIEVNAFAIGRDLKTWENPEQFYPERFVDSSIDIRGRDFELLPFGSGRRGCPGIQMGMAMVMLTMANLVYCFDWKLPEGAKEEDVDVEELPGLVTHKKTPLQLVPIKYRTT